MAVLPENDDAPAASHSDRCQACVDAGASVCPHRSSAFDNVPTDSLIGKTIADRYLVEALIGSGGFGRVYRVEHTGLKKQMALKMLHSSHIFDREKLQRFKQEAEAVSKLDHPNICRVYDFAEGPEHQPCMIMELVEGQRLDELIKERKQLPLNEVLSIGVQICAALASAHTKGIVHRDLKPSNIMLCNGTVKVLDFGLAKILETDIAEARSLTETGGVVGTPAYMSPEQCTGHKIDVRTDVYAIGCILYEAFTGRKAFDGASFLEILNAHLQKTPKPFATKESVQSERSLEALLLKAMDVDPALRYQSIDDLCSDLQKLLSNEKVTIERKKRKSLAQTPVRPLVACGTIAFALCASLGGVWLWSALHQPAEDLNPLRRSVVNGKTLADLNRAIEQNPKSADAFYERGYFHQDRDERDNAIEDYTTAISLDPRHAQSYEGRAEEYLLTSKYDLALADANKSIELRPNWYSAWCEKARIEVAMENYHRAISDAETGLSLFPQSPFGLGILAEAHSGLGQSQSAIDAANTNVAASDNADDGYWAYWDRGSAFLRANLLPEAEQDFKKAISFHNKAAQSWGDLAFAQAGQNKMDDALTSMKHCRALDLFPARAYRLGGEMYRAAGKWEDAIKEYSTSTSLEPWYGPGFRQKAMAEIAAGDLTSAELDLRKALKLEPWSPATNSWLAVAEDQLGKVSDAEEHTKKAFALVSDLPMNFVNRARIKIHHGDFNGAVEDCNQAIKLFSRCPDAYDTRAIALEQIGMKSDAEKDRQTAISLYWHPFASPLIVSAYRVGNSGAGVPVVRPEYGPLKPGTISFQESKLPESKAYAIACSAIFADNLCSAPMDNVCEECFSKPDNWNWTKEWLDSTFEIYDRNSLETALDKLLADAQAATPANTMESRGSMAYDYVAYLTVMRSAYLAGYVTEDEAWDKMLPVAKRIQNTFSSWSDLLQCYGVGRQRIVGRSDNANYNQRAQKLLTDPHRLMMRLSFKDTKLP